MAQAFGDKQAQQWRISDLGNGKVVPSCPRHTRLLDPGCRVAGEQFIPYRRLKFAMALMGKVRNEGQRTMPGVRDLPADPLPARLSERRSMPGRSTSALSKVETDSALERPRTKDVRRVTSPFAARVPVNAAGGAYGNWARPGSSGDRASRGRSANVPLTAAPLPASCLWG